MNAKRPIVHIVDDEATVRESLALLLDVRGFATRCHKDAQSFLASCDPSQPGCVLVDLRMPGMSGAELQAELARRGVALPLIMITAHGDVAATRAAFKAGACDFIEKPIEPEALHRAIESALQQDASSRERAARSSEAASKLDALTGREREVVERAVAGLHNREIASELGISPRTVEVYKARAMEKLGVRRLPDIVRLVMRAEGAAG
jgi:RNA polymerase sigma factor (sigma-70 family)